MKIHKFAVSLSMPDTYRVYLEREYPANGTFASSIIAFFNRKPDPPVIGGVVKFKSTDIKKLIKIFAPRAEDPFFGAINRYLEGRVSEGNKNIEIESRTAFDVEPMRLTQHNARLLPEHFERLEQLLVKYNLKSYSQAFRKEVETDALRKGFRLHTRILLRSKDEF